MDRWNERDNCGWLAGRLRLLLPRGGRRLGLGRLLAVAADHDHAQEGAHHRAAQQHQDHGDADRPDPGGEDVLEGMV